MCCYHPRFETRDAASFQTTRCRNSELWFVANPALESEILGRAAKYAERYEVKLYALAIEGNHIQLPASFPKLNRTHFMRDFNSSVARAVPRYVRGFSGGRLWQRRYSSEIVPFEDLERQFFYSVLQPVQDGLVEKLSDYPFYNCFHDAVHGIKRKFKITRWAEYNEARRRGAFVSIADYTDEVLLQYERLPGYEHLTQAQYALLMNQKLEVRRLEIVRERYASGKRFLGREVLLRARPGSKPKNTKTSTFESFRPRVLSGCPIRRKAWIDWYFGMYFYYKEAARRFREGEFSVDFPDGTYRPPILQLGVGRTNSQV